MFVNNKIVCMACNRSFETIRKLNYHIKKIHNFSQKYYYDIYIKSGGDGYCEHCGNETSFVNLTNGYRSYCSLKCSNNSPSVQDKKRITTYRNYGVYHHMESQEVKEQVWETTENNYGTRVSFQSELVKDKIRRTNLKRYNSDNVLKNKDIQDKQRNTLKKFYGVDNARKIDFVRAESSRKQLENFLDHLYKELDRLEIEFLDEKYSGAHFLHNWRCKKCGYEFKQLWNNIQQGYNCPVCYPRFNTSSGETEIYDFLCSIGFSNIIRNSKKIIGPKEIDVLVPSKNFGIEFDGLYWHSNEMIKDQNSHLNKTIECKNNGIYLVHIFEDEWRWKSEIIKYILKSILDIKTGLKRVDEYRIDYVDDNLKNEFLNKFHIYGEDESTLSLGSFYNNELLSLMTFINHGDGSWEISRFCNNYDYSLNEVKYEFLEFFKKEFNWEKIFSKIDRRFFSPEDYFNLGFRFLCNTKPMIWNTDGYVRGNNLYRNLSISDCGYTVVEQYKDRQNVTI